MPKSRLFDKPEKVARAEQIMADYGARARREDDLLVRGDDPVRQETLTEEEWDMYHELKEQRAREQRERAARWRECMPPGRDPFEGQHIPSEGPYLASAV